ncbi:hypothetical protein HDV02_003732 [Globomyces sp. JEL0801]|nr:hypothetical protein HDV02_003732 [Globomyces sp. JEL0801]
MGCNNSKYDPVITSSKHEKRLVVRTIESGSEWKTAWLEFTDLLEKAQLHAAHWSIGEDDSRDSKLTPCFKSLSLQSTDLFILSREFIESLDNYLGVVSDVLGLMRDLHCEFKKLSKLRLQLSNLLRSNPKVVPLDENISITKYEEISIISKVRLSIEQTEKLINEKKDGIKVMIISIQFESIFIVLSQLASTWKAFSEVFELMNEIVVENPFNSSDESENDNQYPTTEVLSRKFANERSERLKCFSKWIFYSNRLGISWTQLRKSELHFANLVHQWLTLIINTPGSLSGSSSLAFNAFTNLFDEQNTILNQIQARELDLNQYIYKYDDAQKALKAKKPSSNDRKMLQNEFDLAKHKLQSVQKENRRFKMQSLSEFQHKVWHELSESANAISDSYAICFKSLELVRRSTNPKTIKSQLDYEEGFSKPADISSQSSSSNFEPPSYMELNDSKPSFGLPSRPSNSSFLKSLRKSPSIPSIAIDAHEFDRMPESRSESKLDKNMLDPQTNYMSKKLPISSSTPLLNARSGKLFKPAPPVPKFSRTTK